MCIYFTYIYGIPWLYPLRRPGLNATPVAMSTPKPQILASKYYSPSKLPRLFG